MRRHALFLSLFSFTICALLLVQTRPSEGQEKLVFDARILDTFQARNIGPANMGGRIVDLAVVEKNPATFYIAAATGGVWKTTDAGATWNSLTDHFTCSIGAIAVSQSNPDVVWIGGGEANPRNSVTWGDGVYKSTDGGKTWSHMGLKDTQHIGRVVIHPSKPDVVYVAALGHIWGPNPERGLFKTSDGGKTWQHVLKLDADTGCIDVAIDPQEPDILYAAAYAVRRDGYSGGDPARQYGPKAGLYKSIDGGASWNKMTNGLPDNQYGRCGIAIYRKDPKVVYAVVQSDKTGVGTKGNPPNNALDVAQGGVFRSDDRGASWTQLNSLVPRPFYYGQVRIDPSDDQRIYVLGTSFHISSDGGKTFSGGAKKAVKGVKPANAGVHPDHHALWINPKDSNHVILGNDGGLYISKNKATSWTANRGMPLGQFYAVAVDMKKPYRVYGGLQDNGSWGGPSATRSEAGITLADWKSINGADGFHCQCDPDDVNIVYAESQYGKPVRVDFSSGTRKSKFIQPKSADPKGDPNRWNWSAPMLLSPHNSRALFYGSQYLFRSDDRGETWSKISPDLTAGKPGTTYKSTGHTLTTIAESPKTSGVIYTGSDDGCVHVTRDGGKTWSDVSAKVPGVPKDRWITRVECSFHDEATAYLAIGRHRNDDHKPYVFKTTDFGATWTSITNNLPKDGPVHVIRESSKNPKLLFVGTEYTLHVSLDGGKAWHHLKAGLPVVPIHDLVIHPRDRDLVIGTHGRSIYVMDIGPLEELTPQVLAQSSHLFSVRSAQVYVPSKVEARPKSYAAPNPPIAAVFHYFLKQPVKDATFTVLDADSKVVGKIKGNTNAGLQRVSWDLFQEGGKTGQVARPGEYAVELNVGAQRFTQKLRIEAAE